MSGEDVRGALAVLNVTVLDIGGVDKGRAFVAGFSIGDFLGTGGGSCDGASKNEKSADAHGSTVVREGASTIGASFVKDGTRGVVADALPDVVDS